MTSPARRPFRLAHRGHVQCHGILLASRSGFGWGRMAPYYRNGCKLYRLSDGQWALLYASPEITDLSRLDGAALVQYGECFSTLPLSPKDVHQAEFSGQQIVDAVGGRLRHRRISDRDCVEVGDWFTVEDWAFEVAESLTLTVEPTAAINLVAANRREALDHSIGEPPPEAAMFDGTGSPTKTGRGWLSLREMLGFLGRAIQSGIRLLVRSLATRGDGRWR